jgi:hypothetical protein
MMAGVVPYVLGKQLALLFYSASNGGFLLWPVEGGKYYTIHYPMEPRATIPLETRDSKTLKNRKQGILPR